MSANAEQPYGIMTLDSPQRIEHVLTPAGWFGLEIDHSLPGETRTFGPRTIGAMLMPGF
jgi:hypothetical protein